MSNTASPTTKQSFSAGALAAASVAIVVTIVVLRMFVFTPLVVYGDSMLPTLATNDRIVAENISSCCQRGDIVVIKPQPGGGPGNLIKRVIAVGGDTIETRRGVVYIDGVALDEPYLNTRTGPGQRIEPQQVPDGMVYVLGDNREVSIDSRRIGPIASDQVTGIVITRWWPLGR